MVSSFSHAGWLVKIRICSPSFRLELLRMLAPFAQFLLLTEAVCPLSGDVAINNCVYFHCSG